MFFGRRSQQEFEDSATPASGSSPARFSRSSTNGHVLSRLGFVAIGAFTVGSGLGAVQGSKMAGLRFRAEHAHRMPKDTTGWYLYHKSKNYTSLVGALQEGIKMGAKTSVWATAMLAIEALFDTSRGSADMFNTILAGLTVAGGFSLWNRFTIAEAGRTARTALFVSVAWGGLQDVLHAARGQRIGYIEFARHQFNKQRQKSSNASSS